MFLCERDVVRKLLCIYNLACLAAERVTATSADTPHVAIATTHEDAITPYAYSHRSWPRPTPAGTEAAAPRQSRPELDASQHTLHHARYSTVHRPAWAAPRGPVP